MLIRARCASCGREYLTTQEALKGGGVMCSRCQGSVRPPDSQKGGPQSGTASVAGETPVRPGSHPMRMPPASPSAGTAEPLECQDANELLDASALPGLEPLEEELRPLDGPPDPFQEEFPVGEADASLTFQTPHDALASRPDGTPARPHDTASQPRTSPDRGLGQRPPLPQAPPTGDKGVVQVLQEQLGKVPKKALWAAATAGGIGLVTMFGLVAIWLFHAGPTPPSTTPSPLEPAPSAPSPGDDLSGRYKVHFETQWCAGNAAGCERIVASEGTPLEVQRTGSGWNVRFFGKEWTGEVDDLAQLRISVPLGAAAPDVGPLSTFSAGKDGELVLVGKGNQLAVEVAGVPLCTSPEGAQSPTPPGFLKFAAQIVKDSESGPTCLVIAEKGLRPGETKRFVGHQTALTSLEVTADGKALLTSDGSGVVGLWPLEDAVRPALLVLPEFKQAPGFLRLFPDGKTVLSAGGQGSDAVLRRWALDGSRAEKRFPLIEALAGLHQTAREQDQEQLRFEELVLSANGKQALVVCGPPAGDLLVTVWDLEAARLVMRAGLERSLLTAMCALFAEQDRVLSSGRTLSLNRSAAFCYPRPIVALGRSEGSILVSDDQSPTVPAAFVGHEGPPAAIAFSRDANRLASTGSDGTTRVWDLQTRQESHRFRWSNGGLQKGRQAPSAPVIQAPVAAVPASPPADASPAFVPAMSSETGLADFLPGMSPSLQSSNADDPMPVGTVPASREPRLMLVAFTPDGRRVLSSEPDGTIHLWDLECPATTVLPVVRKLPQSPLAPDAVVLAESPDGKYAVVHVPVVGRQGGKGPLQVWDLRENKPIRGFFTPPTQPAAALSPAGLVAVAFSPVGGLLATSHGAQSPGVAGNRLWLWNVESDKPLRGRNEQEFSSLAAAGQPRAAPADEGVGYSPPGYPGPGGAAGYLMPGMVPGYDESTQFSGPIGASSLDFTTDGQSILLGREAIHFLDARTLRHERSMSGVTRCLALSPDGRLLAGVRAAGQQQTASGELAVCEIPTGRELCRVPWMSEVRFSPNGRYLLGTAESKDTNGGQSQTRVLMVSADKGQVVRQFAVASSPVVELLRQTRSPNAGQPWAGGRRMGSYAGTAFTPGDASGPSSTASSSRRLDVTEDGRLLACADHHDTVHLFDVESGRRLVQTAPLPEAIRRIAFGRDGCSLTVATKVSAPSSPADAPGPKYSFEWPTADALRRWAEAEGKASGGGTEELAAVDLSPSTTVDKGNGSGRSNQKPGIALKEVRSIRLSESAALAGSPRLPPGVIFSEPRLGFLAALPDGKHAVSRGKDGQLHVLELQGGQSLRSLAQSRNAVTAWSDGRELVGVIGRRMSVSQGMFGPGEFGGMMNEGFMPGAPYGRGPDAIEGPASFSPMAPLPVTDVNKWDLSNGEVTGVIALDGVAEAVSACAFAPSGKWAVLGTAEGRLYLVNLLRFERPEVAAKNRAAQARAAEPAYGYAYEYEAAGQPKEVRKTTKTRKPTSPVNALPAFPGGTVTALAVLPDNQSFLAAGRDGLIQVCDARTGKVVRSFTDRHAVAASIAPGVPSFVCQLLVSTTGDKAVSLVPGDTMRVWDPGSGKPIATLRSAARCVAISPEGSLAVSAINSDLILWDLNQGIEIARHWLEGNVTALTFLPAGRHLITLTDASLKCWELDAGSDGPSVREAASARADSD